MHPLPSRSALSILILLSGFTSAGAAVPPAERNALIALYQATGGPGGQDSAYWLGPPGTECGWRGVICDLAQTGVHQLDLRDNGLAGTIPPEIGAFSHLEVLELFDNHLTGALPAELGNLTALRELWLRCNELTGPIPPEIGRLENLSTLALNQNRLTGSIPPEIGQLRHLDDLSLSDNQLSGKIPPELWNLTDLMILQLYANNLTGTIPPEIGRLSRLYGLYLWGNQLSGEIPKELGSLTSLNGLNLSYNHFSGTIPSELGNLRRLSFLLLGANHLTGVLPPSLGNLTNLLYLAVEGNCLTGPVPESLAALTRLYPGCLDLRWNALATEMTSDLALFLQSLHPGEVDFRTTQTVPPLHVKIESPAERQALVVSWKPIAYRLDGGYYEVLVASRSDGPFTVAGRTATKADKSLRLTGLTPATTYYVQVRTVTFPHAQNANWVTSELSPTLRGTTLP